MLDSVSDIPLVLPQSVHRNKLVIPNHVSGLTLFLKPVLLSPHSPGIDWGECWARLKDLLRDVNIELPVLTKPNRGPCDL